MTEINHDICAIEAIDAIPHMMKMLAEATSLRFICVARVTKENWTLCARHDEVNFNLQPGDQLDIETTFCDQVRCQNAPIIIENASQDPSFKDSPIPKMYGFESYFSFPVYDVNGAFFGTICGLDPLPVQLKTEKITQLIHSFAELIARQLDTSDRLAQVEQALTEEQETGRLREQYIAILGHDLRTPLSSLALGIDCLKDVHADALSCSIIAKMETSIQRMRRLIGDAMDFTHSKVGRGLPLKTSATSELATFLTNTIAELQTLNADQSIITDIAIERSVVCDAERIAQLLSNLVINALIHGNQSQPVYVNADLSGDLLTISVKNSGPPISEALQAKLFQPFWRNTVRKDAKGLGLGLFIASEIAKAHRGQLSVMSDTNATVFTFSAQLVS